MCLLFGHLNGCVSSQLVVSGGNLYLPGYFSGFGSVPVDFFENFDGFGIVKLAFSSRLELGLDLWISRRSGQRSDAPWVLGVSTVIGGWLDPKSVQWC